MPPVLRLLVEYQVCFDSIVNDDVEDNLGKSYLTPLLWQAIKVQEDRTQKAHIELILLSVNRNPGADVSKNLEPDKVQLVLQVLRLIGLLRNHP